MLRFFKKLFYGNNNKEILTFCRCHLSFPNLRRKEQFDILQFHLQFNCAIKIKLEQKSCLSLCDIELESRFKAQCWI